MPKYRVQVLRQIDVELDVEHENAAFNVTADFLMRAEMTGAAQKFGEALLGVRKDEIIGHRVIALGDHPSWQRIVEECGFLLPAVDIPPYDPPPVA